MSAEPPEPHREAAIRIFYDVSDGWCILWWALDGGIQKRGMWDLDPIRRGNEEAQGGWESEGQGEIRPQRSSNYFFAHGLA